MRDIYQVNAQLRTQVGKGASRRLRHNNKVPAILYGVGFEAKNLTLCHNQLSRSLKSESFYSHILTIDIDGEKHKAVLKDLQRHPFKPKIIHADFQRIDENEKLHMHVPLRFVGEESCPGVKIGGGLVTHLKNEIEIICLPANLPECIEVDMSALEIGQSVHLSELKLPQGVEIVGLDESHDHAVANVLSTRGSKTDDNDEGSTETAQADS